MKLCTTVCTFWTHCTKRASIWLWNTAKKSNCINGELPIAKSIPSITNNCSPRLRDGSNWVISQCEIHTDAMPCYASTFSTGNIWHATMCVISQVWRLWARVPSQSHHHKYCQHELAAFCNKVGDWPQPWAYISAGDENAPPKMVVVGMMVVKMMLWQ